MDSKRRTRADFRHCWRNIPAKIVCAWFDDLGPKTGMNYKGCAKGYIAGVWADGRFATDQISLKNMTKAGHMIRVELTRAKPIPINTTALEERVAKLETTVGKLVRHITHLQKRNVRDGG